ncbi:hypothetical protein [Lysinibacillus sp. NPDC093688]|uniref:hypothetical protein n=1 Tax=Lysinibacillus sp. NPDC093688 TaxID=3390577 RepID=UPI003D05EF3A
MVKSFTFCKVGKFENNGYYRSNQISLFEEKLTKENIISRDINELPPETGEIQLKITPTSDVVLNHYKVFECNFDVKRNTLGKVYGLTFHSYLEPTEFKLYYSQTDQLCIIQTKSDIALSFIRELNRTQVFDLDPVEIKYENIMSKVDEISGAWIAGLKGRHLNAAGLFGVNVHKSPEYIEASSKGELSLIIIKYVNSSDQKEYSVGISHKGSIILYSKLETLRHELDFVYRIHEDLLK